MSQSLSSFAKKSIAILSLLLALQVCSLAQVPVVLAPPPKLQFFDASGRPLSFGCVFTYVSGTTTPLTTYTDATGTVANANPVPLNAGGFAGGGSSGIWLQAGVVYTLKVVSHGGTNCAFGQTQYTVDGIGNGGSTLTVVVPFSSTPTFVIQAQVELFQITLTGNAAANPLSAVGVVTPTIVVFEITQDSSGAHTWTWPSNVIGGSPIGLGAGQTTTQMFVWDGTNAIAVGPANIGSGSSFSFQPGYLVMPNASSVGTTVNTLTKLAGSPSTAVIAAITDTGGIQGVCVAGCSTGGTSLIQQGGNAQCVFDGATTAGHYIQISSTVAGNCHDAGASYPLVGSGQVVGRILSTNGAGGTFGISLFGPEIIAPVPSPGGTPTLTFGAGAGTSPSGSLLTGSTDKMGWITLTTGSAPSSGTGAVVLQVAYSAAFSNFSFCTISPAATTSGLLPDAFINSAGDAAKFQIITNGTALAGTTTYHWSYLCSGY